MEALKVAIRLARVTDANIHARYKEGGCNKYVNINGVLVVLRWNNREGIRTCYPVTRARDVSN